MPLAVIDGVLFAAAVWGLGLAALLAALPSPRARGGSLAALLPSAARGTAIVASLALAAVGALRLAGLEARPLTWDAGLPGGRFALGVDALAAPFVLLLGVVAAISFAARPAAAPGGASRGERAGMALHAAFALALAAVFTARHALLFLLAWEGMTLLSAALVASDTRSARARSACFAYLAISHVGAALLGFGLLSLAARAGSFDFADLAAALARLPAAEASPLVWLISAGLVVKLGLVPVHVWLPLAHPEAPGPISALLSGAMVKAGLYGLLRFAWQMPGVPIAGWGTTLVALGTITALIGALYAVVEPDAKRLLAHSTVKHAGLLALALGLAGALARNGQTALAGVALAACLYHAVGHGLSKALAFLSVAEATHAGGSRDLERLGGLARRLPRLSAGALVAVLSLSGLPLLGCFAGEWLMFQALIRGYSEGPPPLRLLAPFAGAGLALATALAAAAMVKLYGIGFLGRPRTPEAAAARPAAPGIENAQLLLGGLVAAWGLLATWAMTALGAPLGAMLGPAFDPTALVTAGGLALAPPPATSASISPLAIALLLAVFLAVPFAWARASGTRAEVRRAPSWACGIRLDPRMQYSALGLTKPLRLIFGRLLQVEREVEVLSQGSPYFGRALRFRSGIPPLAERMFYQPLVQAVLWASDQARRLQAGNLHLYLGYLLATLVALLVWAR